MSDLSAMWAPQTPNNVVWAKTTGKISTNGDFFLKKHTFDAHLHCYSSVENSFLLAKNGYKMHFEMSASQENAKAESLEAMRALVMHGLRCGCCNDR